MEPGLKAALRRTAAFAWDRPAAAGLLLATLLALAALGLARLQVDFSSASFYGGDHEAVRALEEFHARWGPDDDVVMVIVEAEDGDLLTRDRFAAIERLAGELAALPEVRTVLSIAGQRIVLPGTTLDDAVPLWDLPAIDPAGPFTREALLSRLPFVPLLLSTDGRLSAIVVRLRFSSDDLARVVPAMDAIGRAVESFERPAGLRLHLAGVPAVRASFIGLTLRDQTMLVPLALVVMGAALFWVFRQLHGVLVPGAAALVPLVLLLGIMGWLGEPIGLLNQAYFTLIPVLAVADGVHLLSRYHEERIRHAPRAALLEAVEHTGLACTLTSATTVAAFASLGLGGTPMLRAFGLYAAAGMLIAWATAFVLVPLALRISPGRVPEEGPQPLLAAIASLAVRRPAVIALTAAVISAAMLVEARAVVVDNRLSSLLEPDHPVRQAGELLDRSLGGTLSLEVELRGPDDAFLQPDVIGATAAFEDWAAARDGVRAVIGPGRSLEAVSAATGTLLDSPANIRTMVDRLSTFVDPADVLAPASDRARVSIRVAEPGGRAFQAMADEVLAEARATLEPFGIRPVVTGTTLVAYAGVNRLAHNLRMSLLSTFAVVSLVFLMLFRSVRIALIALAPNLLPLVAGYGALGLMGVDLDPLAGVVLAFGLGVAVDDTIHLLARIREQVRAGTDPRAAIDGALRHSGRAVTITSLVISAGLALNGLSSFPPLELLGVLGAFVMLVALACDLFLLPALLVLFRGERALMRR
jgi:predicted RND superfamily exporter protein